jgi:hypothetical protein
MRRSTTGASSQTSCLPLCVCLRFVADPAERDRGGYGLEGGERDGDAFPPAGPLWVRNETRLS